MDTQQELEAQVRVLETEVAQLRRSLNSRVVIEQAKGALSVTMSVSIKEAFEAIRRQARIQEREIHLVAGEVVRNQGHFLP
jgi:AmiR/NasT family two-component response regulator